MMQWGWDSGDNTVWSIVAGIMMLLFIVAIVAGVVLLARSMLGQQRPPAGETPASAVPPVHTGAYSPALRVLEERYAKGEIDREEFLARKRDLTS